MSVPIEGHMRAHALKEAVCNHRAGCLCSSGRPSCERFIFLSPRVVSVRADVEGHVQAYALKEAVGRACCVCGAAALLRHHRQHRVQPLVAPDAPHCQHLRTVFACISRSLYMHT